MLRIYLILISGIIVVSSSSILIRWTGDVPATIIAFYRVFISFCILLIYQFLNPKQRSGSLLKWHWHYFVAGFFLAAHFITWIASLQMTTIANSIFLESMHPLFGVIVSIILLKEYPKRSVYPILLVAIIGMTIIVYDDLYGAETRLLGDILALTSALFFALYISIARIHKAEKNFIRYLIYIYGSASIFNAIYIIYIGDHFLDYAAQSWILMIIIAIGPNLIGHSILNWSSRHLEIFKVNLVMLLEPLLATLSGIIFLAEYPASNFYLGAGLIMLSLGSLIYLEKRN